MICHLLCFATQRILCCHLSSLTTQSIFTKWKNPHFTLLKTIQLTTVRGLHTMVDNNTMSYKQHDALEAVFDVQNIHASKYDKYEVWQHYAIQTTWRTRGCDASTIHLNSVKLNPSQWTMCAQAKGPWFEPRFGNLLKTFDIISIYFIYFLSFI